MEPLPEQSNELTPQQRLSASVAYAVPVLRFLQSSVKAVECYSARDEDGKYVRAEVRPYYMSQGEESYTGFFKIDGIDKDGNEVVGRLSYWPQEGGGTKAQFSSLGQEETPDADLQFAVDILHSLQDGYKQSQAMQQHAEAPAAEAVQTEASPRFPILHRALGWLGMPHST